MRTSRQTIQIGVLATLSLATLICIALLQMRSATAAGAVAMQVERIVKIAIMEYNSAMRDGDTARWLKYFTDKVRRQAPTGSQEGMQTFADYYGWEFENFEATWTTQRIIVSGPVGVVEFEWDAVHKASNTPVKIAMVAVFELASSGKFEFVRFYFDPAKYADFFAGAPTGK